MTHNIKYSFLKLSVLFFYKKDNCVMKCVYIPNNCYRITSEIGVTCNSAKLDETELWHQRLGHVKFNDLSRLFNSKLIRGIPKLEKPQVLFVDHVNWENKLSPLIRKLSKLQPLSFLNLFIWI